MRNNADFAKLLHRVLSGLGLELPSGGNEWHQRQMNEGSLMAAKPQAHLAGRLQKRQGLYVANRAANFDNGHIRGAVPGLLGTSLDEVLDLVGDMGNDLDGFA